MSSDSITNASVHGKKKRANRSAKLKQCKLDARRQQWLSQVNVEGQKTEVSGNGSRTRECNGIEIEARKGKKKGKDPCEVRSVNVEQIDIHDSDSEESLLANSPTGSVNGSGNGYVGSSGSSTSSHSSASSVSFGSGGCCSGSITEEEEGRGGEFDGDDGCLDDWETVADALVGAETNDKQGHSRDNVAGGDREHGKHDVDAKAEKGILGRGGDNRKAWRPDDAFRPQSLPNLSSQLHFPANAEKRASRGSNPWVCKMPPPVPISCPICYEDLDFTDSSFLPCPCGFHLCLFCHKRILEDDARCPGCRKPYTTEAVEKETSICGGSLTIRLGRSCSMVSRVQ
ncbi:hypothetical protein vseg_003100 [Gypsophila vaccaria]